MSQPAASIARRERALAGVACLGELVAAFNRRRAQLAREVELTEQQWQVLEEIGAERFFPSMFAQSTERTAPAVSRVLRQLSDRGLVAVAVDGEDARRRHYTLTDAGRRVLARLEKLRGDAVDAVWLALAPHELDAFLEGATALAARLRAYVATRE